MIKPKQIKTADQAIDLMKEFEGTASLWQKVENAGVTLRRGGVLSSLFNRSAANAHFHPSGNEIFIARRNKGILESLIHEALHVEQFLNDPILKRSIRFYEGKISEVDEPVLSPRAMTETIVALEIAVLQTQMKLFYELMRHTGQDIKSEGYEDTFRHYVQLREQGFTYLRVIDGEDRRICLPAEYDSAQEREEACARMAAQMMYLMGHVKGVPFRDHYAQEFLRSIEKSPYKKGETPDVEMVELSDETVSAIGRIGGTDVFKNAVIWRNIESSEPIFDNEETKALLNAAQKSYGLG